MNLSKHVCAIGEVALRVSDMDRMIEFYNGKLGLPLLRRFENDVAALRIAEGVAGQVQTLTLFNRRLPSNHHGTTWHGLDGGNTSLHHFALTVPATDYEKVQELLGQDGIEFTLANHKWCGWRGIYVRDPEGNVVELVSYHRDIDEGKDGTYDLSKLHGATNGLPFV